MCQFVKTKIENLYCHGGRKSNLFLYTEKSCPESLSVCFAGGGFVLIFCGEPVGGGSDESEDGLEKLALAASELMKWETDGALAFMEQEEYCYLNWTVMRLHRDGKGCWFVEGGCRFSLRGYRLQVPAGTSVEVEAADDNRSAGAAEQGFGKESLVWSPGRRNYVVEFAREGLCSFREDSLELIMEGERAGCFQFLLSGVKGLHQLGAGICYSLERDEPEYGRYVDTLSCLPFYPLDVPFNLPVLLDVAAPDDGARSRISLPSGNYGSFFPVFCAPDLALCAGEGEISLVFGKERMYRSNFWYRRYLTPEGSMKIESPDGNLLTGLSGLEYLEFHNSGRLCFCPGQEAYFPADPVGKSVNGTTAYVALDTGTYYSQGEDSSFFGGIEKGTGILSYQEIPFRRVTQEDMLPVLPVGLRDIPKNGEYMAEYLLKEQTGAFAERLGKIESERLVHRRNQLMGQQAEAFCADGGRITAITQKGLLASFEVGAMSFLSVELAEKLRLADVSGKIRQALLSAKAFLLISDQEDFRKYASLIREEQPLSVGGWSFDFGPELWEENKTLLLLKYTRHKSIRELSDAPSEWSYPNESKTLVSQNTDRLKAILSGMDNTKEMSCFDRIRAIADDRNWCGAIVFSVKVDGDVLPDNIRFLTKTAGGEPLRAHHLIFDSRTVGMDGDILPAEVSGVIYYSDPFHPAIDEPGEFYYKLDQLVVVIEESRVVDFNCSLSLSFQYFLMSPLYAVNSDVGNYMLIHGGMTAHGDDESLDQYYFELLTPREYELDGSAIDTLAVEGVSLMASYREDRICFFLSGRMGFVLYDSDIFSYGGDESCLYFDHLLLVEEKGVLRTDIREMHFLTDTSKVRKDSLAGQFRVAWKGFQVLEDKDGPEKLGYTVMHCDGIRQEKLGDTFVCAVMEISLGGLGALASAGDLRLSVLAAWTPHQPEGQYDGRVETAPPGLYLGAGIGSFAGVSSPVLLQGVMSMGFDRIELKKTKDTNEFYFYFRDFTLTFLKYQFPDGNNDIYIFGNPDNLDQLGWYGAYEKTKEEKDVC